MTYQEKKSIVNMASTLLVYGIYYWFVYQRYDPVGMTPEELLQFWGKTIITIIPFAIGGKIVIHVIFVISNKIITKENHPDFEDERDKLITLKSARNSYFIFGMSFLTGMILMALGYSLETLFITFVIGGILSDAFDNMSQFYYHRIGISNG